MSCFFFSVAWKRKELSRPRVTPKLKTRRVFFFSARQNSKKKEKEKNRKSNMQQHLRCEVDHTTITPPGKSNPLACCVCASLPSSIDFPPVSTLSRPVAIKTLLSFSREKGVCACMHAAHSVWVGGLLPSANSYVKCSSFICVWEKGRLLPSLLGCAGLLVSFTAFHTVNLSGALGSRLDKAEKMLRDLTICRLQHCFASIIASSSRIAPLSLLPAL